MERFKTWWALEEDLMEKYWIWMRFILLNRPNLLKELWYTLDDLGKLSALDLYFIGRRYMFDHWFKRKFNRWFYKDGETR